MEKNEKVNIVVMGVCLVTSIGGCILNVIKAVKTRKETEEYYKKQCELVDLYRSNEEERHCKTMEKLNKELEQLKEKGKEVEKKPEVSKDEDEEDEEEDNDDYPCPELYVLSID